MASTFRSPIDSVWTADKADWDVTRLADRVKNMRPHGDGDTSIEDAILEKYFKNPQFGDIDMPATMLDRHGRIMVWYLPRIFSVHRMVCIFICWSDLIDESLNLIYIQIDLNGGTKILRPQLDLAMQSCSADKKPSWHNSAFRPPPDGGEFGAGVLNMSPGWFQQSQDVSLFSVIV